MRKLVTVMTFIFLLFTAAGGFAGSDRPELQDRVTKLEGELDSLDAQIQKKEDNVVFYETQKQAGVTTTDDGSITIETKIDTIKSEIDQLNKQRDLKLKELDEAREALRPEPEPAGHYHPRPQPPKEKYPFKR